MAMASRSPASANPSAANARASASPASVDCASASRSAGLAGARAAEPASRPTIACSASGENGLPMLSATLGSLARRASRSPACPRVVISTTGTRASAASPDKPPAEVGGVAPRDRVIQQDEARRRARLAHARQRRSVVAVGHRPVPDFGQHRLDHFQDRRAVVDRQDVVRHDRVRRRGYQRCVEAAAACGHCAPFARTRPQLPRNQGHRGAAIFGRIRAAHHIGGHVGPGPTVARMDLPRGVTGLALQEWTKCVDDDRVLSRPVNISEHLTVVRCWKVSPGAAP